MITAPLALALQACLTPPEPTEFRALQAQVAALDDRMAEAETALGAAETELGALEARLAVAEAALGAAVTVIAEDLTLNIPGVAPDGSELADPHAALRWLSTRVIAQEATVTLQLEGQTYALTAPLRLNHPNGDRLRVVGELGTVVRAEGVTAFEVVTAVGELASMHIESDGGGEGRTYGIHVRDRGVARCGAGLSIAAFSSAETGVDDNTTDSAGVLVEGGALLDCSGVALSLAGNRQGLIVREGAVARVGDAVVSDSTTSGLWAYANATLLADGVEVAGTGNSSGAHISGASYASIGGGQIHESAGHGVSVSAGAFAALNSAIVENNQRNGVFVDAIAGAQGNDLTARCNALEDRGRYYDLQVNFSSSLSLRALVTGSGDCEGLIWPQTFAGDYEDALIRSY